jgi:hypothetical protein
MQQEYGESGLSPIRPTLSTTTSASTSGQTTGREEEKKEERRRTGTEDNKQEEILDHNSTVRLVVLLYCTSYFGTGILSNGIKDGHQNLVRISF